MRSPRIASILALAGVLVVPCTAEPPAQDRAALGVVVLEPTAHAPLPDDPSEFWLAPNGEAGRTGQAGVLLKFAQGVEHFREERFDEALAQFSAPGLSATPLADYATYYRGLTQLRLNDIETGRRTLSSLKERPLEGYLSTAAVLARAEAAERAEDFSAAVQLYEELAADQPLEPHVVLYRLGLAAQNAKDTERAAAAFLRVRYEFPLSDEAALADAALDALAGGGPRPNTAASFDRDLGRAERLFGARRYAMAREAFADIRSLASGDGRTRIAIRIAESDYYLRRYRGARDGLRPYLGEGPLAAEAQFFYLASLRELGERDEYVARVRALVDKFPDSSWAEEALNNLGTHYILENEDGQAAEVFREMLQRFPKGDRAPRAAWKYGWWEYKNGRHEETVRVFENAAAAFPRSDYRPSWIYWAARARERLGDAGQAAQRYHLLKEDYQNSYYGRIAARRLEGLDKVARAAYVPPARQEAASAHTLPPTASLIRLLLSLGLEDDALNELTYAQRQWGSSPVIEATIAWVYHRQGDLRRAINQMKRAYPQYLTAEGGTKLPDELMRIIFPLDYWDSIRRHANARGVDPYVAAALIAQESTFDADIRSAANAYGLMQVVPGTGRRLARALGIRYRGTRTLTTPETNLRMGMLYLSRLINQFGDVHLALAAYNAGENRVVRWTAERPGLDRDEFIDDIPFPETQNYVKKILGTAEDYRALYPRGTVRTARPTR
jgi:soluble lytic murein transglycosylase